MENPMMTARRFGLWAIFTSLLLLGVSLVGGGTAMGQRSMESPHVADAWVRLPAAAGRPAAGYFLIHGTTSADALVAASSPMAERVELHDMVNEGGVMRMRARASFDVPARGELRFAPGGAHLMLFGLSDRLRPGDTVPLTLTFRSGATATVAAQARAPGAQAPASGAHPH
jgi:copper(I)-binding protein